MAYASLAELVQSFENPAADPTLYNYQGGTASGLYQFVPSTWRRYLAQIGGDTSAYPEAATAPAAVQDQVFAQAVAQRGLGDWTCPGCNPRLAAYVAANPDSASLPALSGGASGAASASASANATTPSGSIWNPATWFTALGDWFASVAARGGLFILGLIFIIGALMLFAIRSGIEIETRAE